MTIDNPKMVDAIGVEKETGKVVLTISDHFAWDDKEHLPALQKKLNTYLAFIESGEIDECYPASRGRPPVISLVMKFEPDTSGQEFLKNASLVIQKAGFEFRTKILNIPE